MVGLVESKTGGRITLVIGGTLLAVDAFGLDLALAPNFAIGVAYALVVVLGLWWTDQSYIVTSAILVSVLCLLGFYFSFSNDPLWMGVVERGFALIVIWLVAVLCFFHKKEKIEKLELLERTDHFREEQFKLKNALEKSRETLQDHEKENRAKLQILEKESREKIQGMERNTARLQLKILEREALLDQVEVEFAKVNKTLQEQESRLIALAREQGKGTEAFERLQESLNRLQEDKIKTEQSLLGKDAQIEKAEADRNRTAGALWEKEQQLANVLDDLSLLENNLQNNMTSIDQMKEALEKTNRQLYERDDRLTTMENSLNKIHKELEEKARLLDGVESKLLAVESQYHLAQKTLKDREGLLEKIEQQIRESLTGNTNASASREFERIAGEQKEKQKKQIEWDLARRSESLTKSTEPEEEPIAQDRDQEPEAEKPNGNHPPLDKEIDDQKITDRFRRYAGELKRSNEDLREFASIASHDLQEPLRKIIGFGMRLKKDCSPYLDDKGKDYLERMERSAQKMQNFVDDLLRFSKVTASPPRHYPVDLKDIISQVLTVLESRIEETHPEIEVGSLPVIEGDRMQMAQLFQNLISNALKFHKKGEPPVIRISHQLLENGFHEIRVQDQGIGFDEKHAEHIFKPFERLHGNSEYEGTGMGLAICKKIVLRHGGGLRAESSPQEGTTFIVTLATRAEKQG